MTQCQKYRGQRPVWKLIKKKSEKSFYRKKASSPSLSILSQSAFFINIFFLPPPHVHAPAKQRGRRMTSRVTEVVGGHCMQEEWVDKSYRSYFHWPQSTNFFTLEKVRRMLLYKIYFGKRNPVFRKLPRLQRMRRLDTKGNKRDSEKVETEEGGVGGRGAFVRVNQTDKAICLPGTQQRGTTNAPRGEDG